MAPRYRLPMTYPTAATRDIAAPAEKVWALVSDLPRMGEWSPENAGGKSIKGATGPALGAVFQGTNKNGVRRWSTTATVIACEPSRAFEFAVTSGPLAVASWRYEFEETDAGSGDRVLGGPARTVVRHHRTRHGRPQCSARREGDGGDAGQPGRRGRVTACRISDDSWRAGRSASSPASGRIQKGQAPMPTIGAFNRVPPAEPKKTGGAPAAG